MALVSCPAALNACRCPQQKAVSWSGRSLAWEAFNNYIHSTSRHLKEIGLRTSENVVVVREDTASYIVVLLALWRIRAVVCPVDGEDLPAQAGALQRLVKPGIIIGPQQSKRTRLAGSRWADIEHIVAYGYNDPFLGNEALLDPKIDTDSSALARLTLEKDAVSVRVLSHAQLKEDPQELAGLFHSLATGEPLILS